MANFTRVLRRAESSLQAAEPQRSQILLEISGDLEAGYAELLARGFSAEEAAERAEAMFGASCGVLAELDEVHLSGVARFLARFSGGERHRVERALLTAVTLGAVAAATGGIFTSGLASPIPLFLWPLPAVLAAAVWSASTALLDLLGRPGRPLTRERLQPLLALAGLSAALGILGALVQGWRLAGIIEGGPMQIPAILPYLRRGAELLALYLSQSLLILLGWFHLRIRALVIEGARTEARRLTHPDSDGERS